MYLYDIMLLHMMIWICCGTRWCWEGVYYEWIYIVFIKCKTWISITKILLCIFLWETWEDRRVRDNVRSVGDRQTLHVTAWIECYVIITNASFRSDMHVLNKDVEHISYTFIRETWIHWAGGWYRYDATSLWTHIAARQALRTFSNILYSSLQRREE